MFALVGGARLSHQISRVKTADFDYELPAELIAQQPAARRDEARLLVVHRATRTLEHRRFFDLPEYLRAGDLLIRNTARVRPARLLARRPGGGRVECLLLRPLRGPDTRSGPTAELWWCLLRPGRKLPVGATFGMEGEFTARVLEKSPPAEYLVAITPTRAGDPVAAVAERMGRVPLPPYIRRAENVAADPQAAEDRERYQTVFADRAHTVAVAAPTAGLHFSDALLAQVARAGVECADVVLHVGLGTFRPIETEDVAAHPIHREMIEIPAATRARLAGASTGRRIAVGTTAVRAIEHYARCQAAGGAGEASTDFVAEADLFIYPPATFRIVDALITNFHLPRSTLLCLVAAFLAPGATDGASWWREIYATAIRERYRFLSYGDAMLIL